MKNSDIRRLASISIKSRKKSTRNTVVGISFGLILLIPVLFFSLAFYVDLSAKVNEIKTAASVEIYGKHFSDPSPSEPTQTENGQIRRSALMSFAMIDSLAKNPLVAESLYCQNFMTELTYSSGDGYGTSISIGGGDYIPMTKGYDTSLPTAPRSYYTGTIKVIAYDLSGGKIITNAERQDMKKMYNADVLSGGEGFTHSAKGKSEVIVSPFLLKKLRLSAEDALGKTFSLSASGSAVYIGNGDLLMDNDTDPNNAYSLNVGQDYDVTVHLMKDFKIVGVVDENYYRLSGKREAADIWITDRSLYYEAEGQLNQTFAPVFTEQDVLDEYSGETYRRTVVTYPSLDFVSLSEQAAERGMVFPFISGMKPSMPFQTSYSDNRYFTTVTLQAKSYADAAALNNAIAQTYKTVNPETNGYGWPINTNEIFQRFSMMNTTGNYIVLIFSVFGGIIFLATMLNLYNSVNYSVEARKNYIGVMRAIGAQQKLIPKMYLMEILLIFARAAIWVLLFSCGISVGIKYGMDAAFVYVGEIMGISLSINFLFFFAALAIVLAVVFAIGVVFSQIACKNVAKKDILYVLSDER